MEGNDLAAIPPRGSLRFGPRKRVVLMEEYCVLTGGIIPALVLSQLISLTLLADEKDRLTKSEQRHLGTVRRGESTPGLSNGWIPRSAHEMAEDLMNAASRPAVAKALQGLVKSGVVEARQNPDPKAIWDRKKQYKVNLKELDCRLRERGYSLPVHPTI